MKGSSPRNARAALTALVLLALFGARPALAGTRWSFGFAIGSPYVFAGPYPGWGGYGGGAYLVPWGYGGLSLGLGGYSGGVILGVGGHGGVPYSYVLPTLPAGGLPTAPVLAPLTYGAPVAPAAPPVVTPGDSVLPGAPATVLPGGARTIGTLSAETVDDGVLRVTWRDDGSGAREITLFLADAERKILAQRGVPTAPFTALFQRVPGTAYVGVTRHYADGVEATTLMPAPTTSLRTGTELPPG
jgi:hypothetical protein